MSQGCQGELIRDVTDHLPSLIFMNYVMAEKSVHDTSTLVKLD